MITQEMIISDAQQEFGNSQYENEKILLAKQAMNIGIDWMESKVKSEDPNMTRGDRRRARRNQRIALTKHIEDSLKQDEHAVGFLIPGFILSMIFQSVMSWVIHRLLNKYYS